MISIFRISCISIDIIFTLRNNYDDHSCHGNQLYEDSKCICPDISKLDGKNRVYPEHINLTNNKCVCVFGYTPYHDKCLPIPTCIGWIQKLVIYQEVY